MTIALRRQNVGEKLIGIMPHQAECKADIGRAAWTTRVLICSWIVLQFDLLITESTGNQLFSYHHGH